MYSLVCAILSALFTMHDIQKEKKNKGRKVMKTGREMGKGGEGREEGREGEKGGIKWRDKREENGGW